MNIAFFKLGSTDRPAGESDTVQLKETRHRTWRFCGLLEGQNQTRDHDWHHVSQGMFSQGRRT